MIIIAGYSLTEAANRDAAVAAFQPIVERARSQSGCLDLHISADPLDAQRKIANPPDVEFLEIRVDLFRTERAERPFLTAGHPTVQWYKHSESRIEGEN